MKKRLEVLVRLVDGGQLYWDTMAVVEDLTDEEIEALRPRSTLASAPPIVPAKGVTPAAHMQVLQNRVRAKFQDTMSVLWDRIAQKIR